MTHCDVSPKTYLPRAVRMAAAFAVALSLLPFSAAAQSLAVRSFISPVDPGGSINVSVRLSPPAGATGATLMETLPAGWTATGISDGGNQASDTVMWTLADGSARNLTYTLNVPMSEMGVTREVSGSVDFTTSGANVMAGIEGDKNVTVTPIDIPVRASRTIPFPTAQPGGTVDGITVTLNPPMGTSIVIVTETVPDDWTPVTDSITPDNGLYNDVNNTIRWTFLAEPFPANVSYGLNVPAASDTPGAVDAGQFNIDGEVGVGVTVFPTLGDERGFIPVSGDIIEALLNRVELTFTEREALDMNGNVNLDIGDAIILINNE